MRLPTAAVLLLGCLVHSPSPNAGETAGADASLSGVSGIEGCIAPEDLDQPMREGRRERRLEYRAPRQPGQGDVFIG